jgi:dephospho-CoA kinase
MKLFGLTGGIGMGKSTGARLLRERDVPVVDTDTLARQLVEPGQPALDEIQRHFGSDIVDGRGRLRRDELARRIFADATARRELESILHPRIRQLWQAQVAAWREERRSCGVVVIPLLFETDARAKFDAVICEACTRASQLERLDARGWTREQIERRLEAQWPVERKMELSDFIIWTEGSMEAHAEQLRLVLP